MALTYNNPNTTKSTIDVGGNSEQLETFYQIKKALVDAERDQYFQQLADVTSMPKHYGKVIKEYQYIPLLDDRNKNDQGIDAAGATLADGNLYGSSKDIGNITSKLPVISENGGRVNRVGFTRKVIEGTMKNYGFFYEWTEDAVNFDTDAELRQHLATELVHGANEMTEDLLQMDLLNSAGVVVYPLKATADNQIDDNEVISYDAIMRLDRILTDNRTPKKTTVITGSRMTDTKTIDGRRVAYVGPELTPLLRKMQDPFGNPAFVPIEQYGAATTLLRGEIGAIGPFRIIEHPEMLHWEGTGAAASSNTVYASSNGNLNVYPFLAVGEESFTTIAFKTDGNSAKFKIITKEPGAAVADKDDPYGKKGFSSLQFWYGFLCKRPERIGLIKTVAPI